MRMLIMGFAAATALLLALPWPDAGKECAERFKPGTVPYKQCIQWERGK